MFEEPPMRKLFCGAAAILTLLAMAVTVRAAEEAVPLDKLPKKVTEAVKSKFPKAELVKASKEDVDGKPGYEITIKAEDTTMDVTVTEDGKIVLIEKTITAKQLPKAVASAVEEKYPKATYKRIEEISKDDKIEKYEILLVTTDKKTLEVTFDPKGKFLDEEKKETKEPKEEKTSKKDDDDKDEKKGKGKKDDEKNEGKKSDATVDLSKLSPKDAKMIRELVKELEKIGKGEAEEKKSKNKKDDDDDEKEKKSKNKKDDDDKDEKKKEKQKDKDEN